MIRKKKRETIYTTANFPECIFEKNTDLFKIKRDDYLQSGTAIYDKAELFDLRKKASNAESAAGSRRKRKNYKSKLQLQVAILKRKNKLLEEKKRLVLSQIQSTLDNIRDANGQIKKYLENNPLKAVDQFSEAKALGVDLGWLESFGGLDGMTTEKLLEDM